MSIVNAENCVSVTNARDKIGELESFISKLPGAMFGDCFPLKHSFAKGLLVRQISVPKGVLIISKIHKYSHAAFLLKGEISIYGTEGVCRMKAPVSLITPAGTKRAVYHHEDTIFCTVHATNETDIDKIEEEIIVKDFSEVDGIIDAEFVGNIYRFLESKNKFNPAEYRELTKKIIAAEKDGFWSDWTQEQQEAYKSGDWKKFSISRGYSEEEINDHQRWLDMRDSGEDQGFNTYEIIIDLATEAALKNIEKDTKGEILLSSHVFANIHKSINEDILKHGRGTL